MKVKIEFHHFIIFIASTIVISNQLVLIQYLSYQQWYNFASIVISLALFGFGISGLIVSKLKRKTLEEVNKAIHIILLASSFSIPVSIFMEKFFIGSFDSYLVFFDLSESLKFFLIIFNYSIPFCLLATLIGLIFTISAAKIGTLYFFNLTGSGIGGIIAVYLLWQFDPQKIYLINGLIISILGLGFYFVNRQEKNLFLQIINLLILVLNVLSLIIKIENHPSQFKSLARIKNFPDTKTILQQNSPYGKIEIVNSSLLRYSPGLSLSYTEEISPSDAIFINAELAGLIVQKKNNSNFNFLRSSTLNLPFAVQHIKKILVLNSIGNIEIQRALINEVEEIFVTEKNPLLFQIISSQINEEHKCKLRFINEDPRVYLEKSNVKFDLIFYPVIEPVGYSAGLYSVQEKYLFTKEAFQKVYERLNSNGYFAISCYIDNPLKTFLKLLNLITTIQNSDKSKINKQQIIAIHNWNTITILVKKGEFSRTEIFDAEKFALKNQFDFLIHPYRNGSQKFNLVIDPQTYYLIDYTLNGKYELLKNYAFNLFPSIDDKPYFSNFILPSKIKIYLDQMNLRNITYSELGFFLIWLALVMGIVFSLVLIILALKGIKINSKVMKLNLLIYFSTIGFAFMLMEISLIQKFTLVFSSDILSISFIISLLLVSSGIGSYISQKFLGFDNRIQKLFVLIFIIQIIFLVFSNEITSLLMEFSGNSKYLISGLIIFPIGFLVGIPFPIGIRKFSIEDENAVPFAWAINGSFSVLGSVSAMIFLINFGFKITFFISAFLYLLVGIFIHRKIIR